MQANAESRARQSAIHGGVQPVCPFCAEKPVAAVLRPEGDGGKRFLLCSLCFTEWEFRRLLCPNCGEEDKDKLPIYTAAEMPHVRVEACDTCRVYLKAIDLTKNGLAVPEVDELACRRPRPLGLRARLYQAPAQPLRHVSSYGNLPYTGSMEKVSPTARLEARLPVDVHALLKRAAEIQGRSLTDFVVTAAREAASRAIEETEILRLSVEDQQRIADAILHPPKPAPALRRAFKRRRELFGRA